MTADGASRQIGRRVRDERLRRQLRQADLLAPGLLSAGYLSLIEAGQRQPSEAVLRHLATVLGTTVDYLATGTPSPDHADAQRRIAFAELALHNGDPAAALAEFTALADSPVADRAALGRARALEFQGELDAALAAFEQLRKAAEPGSLTWADRTVDVMRNARNLGDGEYAIQIGESAMDLLEAQDVAWTDASIRLGVTLAGAHENHGNLHRATLLLQRLAAAADELGSPLARGSAYWNAAVVAHRRGHVEQARELAERALAMLGETDHLRNIAQLRHSLAYMLVHDTPARPEQAMELLGRARAALAELGSTPDVARCDATLALARLKVGDTHGAMESARAARDAVRGAADRVSVYALLTLAEVELATGDPHAAHDCVTETEDLLDGMPDEPWATSEWTRIGVLREALGHGDRALAAYRRALSTGGYRIPAITPAARGHHSARGR